MDGFRKILVVCRENDSDNGALQRAALRARKNGALLTIADVVQPFPHPIDQPDKEGGGGAPDLSFAADLADIRKSLIDRRSRELTALAAPLKDGGVNVAVEVLFGVPFLAIIEEVLRNGHDLVMLTAERATRLRASLFGITSMQLMRKCPCPVWVFRRGGRKKHSIIIAAVNPVPYDEERNALNVRIIELAMSLAATDGAEVIVAHAWGGVDAAIERKWLSWTPPDKAEEFNRQMKHMREVFLKERLLGPYEDGAPSYRIAIREGDPRDVIPKLARDKGADLIVMGTVCRSGVTGFFMGNTAESILERARCSVLTVKPEDFRCPVELPQRATA